MGLYDNFKDKSREKRANEHHQHQSHRAEYLLNDDTPFDVTEAFRNLKAALSVSVPKKNGGVAIGGTDFHHRGHEGCLFTCFAEMPETEQDLVRLLRSGDYVFMMQDKVILG